jgi:hypothetical protein
MIRPEKEERFASLQVEPGKTGFSEDAWTNPIHMKRLDKYLKNEEINRNELINTLNQNI